MDHAAASTKATKIAARTRRWHIRAAEDDDRDDGITALCGADADNQETPAK
jgi:hypothetical protein